MLYNTGNASNAGGYRANTQRASNWADNLSFYQQRSFAEEPDLALEAWLKQLGMPNSGERWMRSAFKTLYDGWQADTINRNGPGTEPNWFTDYLSRYDVNKEKYKLSPFARFEDPTKFNTQARVVAF